MWPDDSKKCGSIMIHAYTAYGQFKSRLGPCLLLS